MSRVRAVVAAAVLALAWGPAGGQGVDTADPSGSAGPPAAVVLGSPIDSRDPEELRYLVLRALTDRYAAEHGIAVTPDEIDAYTEAMARRAAADRQRRQARREQIRQALAAPDLDPAGRDSLSAELGSLDRLERELADTGGSSTEEDREARRIVAAAFIRQWKLDRALYRDYGGRVIFQQGGPEPLDAYRELLEQAQRRGDFEILDEDLASGFWRYYRDDSIHSFYPPDGGDAARLMETPWWLSE